MGWQLPGDSIHIWGYSEAARLYGLSGWITNNII